MIEVQELRSGRRVVSPKGSLGTIGWSPKPWQMTYVYRNETPLQAFLRGNPNWLDQETRNVHKA